MVTVSSSANPISERLACTLSSGTSTEIDFNLCTPFMPFYSRLKYKNRSRLLTYKSKKPRKAGSADVAEWSSPLEKGGHSNASALRADSPSGDQEFESPHPRLTFFLQSRGAACTLPAGCAPT